MELHQAKAQSADVSLTAQNLSDKELGDVAGGLAGPAVIDYYARCKKCGWSSAPYDAVDRAQIAPTMASLQDEHNQFCKRFGTNCTAKIEYVEI